MCPTRVGNHGAKLLNSRNKAGLCRDYTQPFPQQICLTAAIQRAKGTCFGVLCVNLHLLFLTTNTIRT